MCPQNGHTTPSVISGGVRERYRFSFSRNSEIALETSDSK